MGAPRPSRGDTIIMKHLCLSRRWRHWALVALALWTLVGCSRCRRDDPLSGIQSPIPGPGENAPGTTALTDRPPAGETVLIQEMEIVHFAYDSDALSDEAQAALERNARWLRDNPDARVLIEGHCDERGTDEYNYALGERRANATLTYLRNLNVPGQLYTRSYGETRPAREGHTESAWSQNRRAQFSRYAN